MRKRGKLITLEGIDGGGKTTHVRLLTEALKGRGLPVVCTFEPGDTPLGKELRRILLEGNVSINSKAELLLYMADRVQHVEDLISPYVEKGYVVVCERYIDSTLVYQGDGRGIDKDFIDLLNRWAVGRYIPDLTIVLTLPVDVAFERIKSRSRDRMERNDMVFFQRLMDGYYALSEKKDRNVVLIDATREKSVVHADVLSVVLSYLEKVGYLEG